MNKFGQICLSDYLNVHANDQLNIFLQSWMDQQPFPADNFEKFNKTTPKKNPAKHFAKPKLWSNEQDEKTIQVVFRLYLKVIVRPDDLTWGVTMSLK